MSKPLNFNKAKKTYLTVTLNDEANTTIMIGTPTKAIMDDLMTLQDTLQNVSENSGEATEELYRVCARLMSRNKAGKTITSADLEDVLDFEDIIIFFDAYMDFISEVTNLKN